MRTIKKKRKLDSVKMMRRIRDKISAETMDMSFAELKEYMDKQLAKSSLHQATR